MQTQEDGKGLQLTAARLGGIGPRVPLRRSQPGSIGGLIGSENLEDQKQT